jgi:kinesin family protein C1
MEGPDHPTVEDAGMIPRAVEQIYAATEKLKKQGWEYTMEAQYLEIYNESLRDLLSDGQDQKKLEIKHDHQKGRTTVTEATVGND